MNTNQNAPFGSEAAAVTDDTVTRVAQGAHAIVDRVAEKASPAVERLRSGVNNAAEALQSGTHEIGELQDRWVENCRLYVRDNPLTSIGVALAVGIIVSRLMER